MTLPKKRRQGRASFGAQTRPKLSSFSRSLLRAWRTLKLPLADAAVVVAVSGGSDSLALLLGLDELTRAGKLKITIHVAHLDHQLRGQTGAADARAVKEVCRKLDYACTVARTNVSRRAASSGDNIEQAARRARYEFFAKISRSQHAQAVVTGHTMDDQAETVLLNLLRGSGADGLAGMAAVRAMNEGEDIVLARPLLTWATRTDTENYCRRRAFAYRVDEMNSDEKFARVRARTQLVPLLKTFNPAIVEGLARTADILRDESAALDAAAARLVELAAEGTAGLRMDLLRLSSPGLRRRAIRRWLASQRGGLRRLTQAHIAAVENLILSSKSGRVTELPGGGTVSRAAGKLRYHARPRRAA